MERDSEEFDKGEPSNLLKDLKKYFILHIGIWTKLKYKSINPVTKISFQVGMNEILSLNFHSRNKMVSQPCTGLGPNKIGSLTLSIFVATGLPTSSFNFIFPLLEANFDSVLEDDIGVTVGLDAVYLPCHPTQQLLSFLNNRALMSVSTLHILRNVLSSLSLSFPLSH